MPGVKDISSSSISKQGWWGRLLTVGIAFRGVAGIDPDVGRLLTLFAATAADWNFRLEASCDGLDAIEQRLDFLFEFLDGSLDVVDSLVGNSTDDIASLVVLVGLDDPVILKVGHVFVWHRFLDGTLVWGLVLDGRLSEVFLEFEIVVDHMQ